MSQEEIVKLKDGTKALVLCKGPCALTVRPLNWDKNKIERMGGENFAFVSIGWDWVKEETNGEINVHK